MHVQQTLACVTRSAIAVLQGWGQMHARVACKAWFGQPAPCGETLKQANGKDDKPAAPSSGEAPDSGCRVNMEPPSGGLFGQLPLAATKLLGGGLWLSYLPPLAEAAVGAPISSS